MSLGWAAPQSASAPRPAGACTRWRWSSVPEAGCSGVAERPAAGPRHRGPQSPGVRPRNLRGQCRRRAVARGWCFDSGAHAPCEPRSLDQSHVQRPTDATPARPQGFVTIASNLHCVGEMKVGAGRPFVGQRPGVLRTICVENDLALSRKAILCGSCNGERGRNRTCDPRLKRALLYQLSYAPHQFQSNTFSARICPSGAPHGADVAHTKAIHFAFMPRHHFFWAKLALTVCAILSPTLGHAAKKQLPSVRWTAGAPGCAFERGDDGRYRWTMTGDDLSVTLLVDSQELKKSRRRFYHLLGVYLSVTYTGQDKFEFPADVRIDFVRHHDVLEGYMDPTTLSTKLQNDVDTLVFETERQIKKNPTVTEEKTARLREYEKEAAEFIEFLSTQSLESATLNPGNPEAHGWVFFATSNKWIGPWKDREDFILGVWMKDKVWQFPFSLPPTEGDLILRKPP